jgi:hypothetical protein
MGADSSWRPSGGAANTASQNHQGLDAQRAPTRKAPVEAYLNITGDGRVVVLRRKAMRQPRGDTIDAMPPTHVGDVVTGMARQRQGYQVSLGGPWIAVFYVGHGEWQQFDAACTRV